MKIQLDLEHAVRLKDLFFQSYVSLNNAIISAAQEEERKKNALHKLSPAPSGMGEGMRSESVPEEGSDQQHGADQSAPVGPTKTPA